MRATISRSGQERPGASIDANQGRRGILARLAGLLAPLDHSQHTHPAPPRVVLSPASRPLILETRRNAPWAPAATLCFVGFGGTSRNTGERTSRWPHACPCPYPYGHPRGGGLQQCDGSDAGLRAQECIPRSVISGARLGDGCSSSRLAPTLTPAYDSCPLGGGPRQTAASTRPHKTSHDAMSSCRGCCYSGHPFAETRRRIPNASRATYHLDDPPTQIRGSKVAQPKPMHAACSTPLASGPAPLS